MTAPNANGVRSALRAALTGAMTKRDGAAMAVFRSALSALDNAGAVQLDNEHPVSPVQSSAAGVGRTDAERRSLTRADEIEIVKPEVHDRLDAAQMLAITRPDAARQLRSDAGLLQTLLDGLAVDN